MSQLETYEDVAVEVNEAGEGRPILLLHGGGGPASCAPLAAGLAAKGRVFSPIHPGFAGTDRPEWLDSVDDLAYLYLDWLAARNLEDVVLIGASIGGWIAAEMAVRDASRIGDLVLIDPVGIRVGGVEDRDIADIFALSRGELNKLLFHDIAKAPPSPMDISPEEAEALAYNQEAVALYAWEPYMHNPKLRRRLGRLNTKTSVLWGESDGVVSPDYGRAYADAIPGADFHLIEEAGHLPQVEQTERVLDVISAAVDLGRTGADS